jgi:hypothetical protein
MLVVYIIFTSIPSPRKLLVHYYIMEAGGGEKKIGYSCVVMQYSATSIGTPAES